LAADAAESAQSVHAGYSFDLSASRLAHNRAKRGNACLRRRLGFQNVPYMEPIMINLRVLSTVAAIAVLLPMAAPTASFAQNQKAAGGVRVGGGGGGAPAARFNGGGGAPAARFNGGGGAARFNGGGGAPVARFNGGGGAGPMVSGGAPQARFSDGRSGWRDRDGDRRRGGGGFGPGFAAGAIIGGAVASQSYGYYGGQGYYAPGYYDDQYYDAGPVAVAPAPGGDDAVAYCMQTYQSYDPASGTYLGYDGFRHPCP
jgi:hypothetical protein